MSGEVERERRSRRFNGAEALLVHTCVLFTLWPLAYGVGVLGGHPWMRPVATILLVVLTVFLLVVSPRLHGDELSAWGLGTPARFLAHWQQRGPGGRIVVILLLGPLAAGMLLLNHTRWGEILAFLDLDFRFLLDLPTSWPGLVIVWLWGGSLVFLFLFYAIRYDNFPQAFFTGLKIALPLCGVIVFAAVLRDGWGAFHHKPPDTLLLQAFGYIFWGFLQQLLFSGYFCTRLRRAFPPAARGPRWPRRLFVAALVASCFATIHLDSYSLVAATFLLGLPLAYVFMEDRNRNLVALSVVHALTGTTLHWLFASEKSGEVSFDYNVGPWNVSEPTYGVLVVPTVLMLSYLLLAWVFAARGTSAAAAPRVSSPGGASDTWES